MATFTRKKLAHIQLANSKGDVYDPGTSIGLVHTIILFNSNTTAETVVLNYHDGTNEYAILTKSLAANETLFITIPGEGLVVDASSKLTGSTTTASKVTCTITGTEEA